MNKTALRDLGITHVLNVAQGNSGGQFVNTDAKFYKRFAKFHKVCYKVGVATAKVRSQSLNGTAGRLHGGCFGPRHEAVLDRVLRVDPQRTYTLRR